MDLCEFEANLVYRVSSKTGFKATQRNPVSGREKEKKKKEDERKVSTSHGARN